MHFLSMIRPANRVFAALTVLFPASWTPVFAQAPPMQQRPCDYRFPARSAILRESPIVDASVFLKKKPTAASIEAKTDHEGTFSFLSLRAGSFLVRRGQGRLREAVSGPMELSLGKKKKQLDLVLLSKPSVHEKAIESKFTGRTLCPSGG